MEVSDRRCRTQGKAELGCEPKQPGPRVQAVPSALREEEQTREKTWATTMREVNPGAAGLEMKGKHGERQVKASEARSCHHCLQTAGSGESGHHNCLGFLNCMYGSVPIL